MSRTVTRRHWPSTESIRRSFTPSPLVRIEALRQEAAALSTRLLTRPAKQYRPFLSPQKLSELRKRGGSVGDVSVVMLADPPIAQMIAAYIQGVADSITLGADCVVMAARENQHDDSAQDNARTELLAAIAEDRLTAGELEALVAACDAQIASTRVLRRAAAAKIGETRP
jgi:hypothetical protein